MKSEHFPKGTSTSHKSPPKEFSSRLGPFLPFATPLFHPGWTDTLTTMLFHTGCALALYLLLACYLANAAPHVKLNSRAIQRTFVLKAGSSSQFGCNPTQIAALNVAIEDAKTLANAAIKALAQPRIKESRFYLDLLGCR